MSSSGHRYHIPFPSNFLSLNSPLKRSASVDGTVPTLGGPVPTHTFLSNRPVAAHRHASVSSISSTDSSRSAPSSPAAQAANSPVPAPQVPAFLPLNSKFAPPPTRARPVMGGKSHSFLSNRH